jgi:hypothetical protein
MIVSQRDCGVHSNALVILLGYFFALIPKACSASLKTSRGLNCGRKMTLLRRLSVVSSDILPRSFPFEVDNGNPTKNGSL